MLIIFSAADQKIKMNKRCTGFTLIEMIAVLVILGILAAISVPLYLQLQRDAEAQAVLGALGAGSSAVSMLYAQALATGTATATSWGGTGTMTLGDFTGSYSDSSGVVTVTITAGPSWTGDLTAAQLSTSVRVY